MQRTKNNELVYYRFESLAACDEVSHGVFTRLGGVSRGIWSSLNLSQSTGDDAASVAENRRRMFSALETSEASSVTTWLTHGSDVRVVDQHTHKTVNYNDIHADALITCTPGINLTMRYADCVPVLLYDPSHCAIGIAHAGWLGVVRGIIPAVIDRMKSAFSCCPDKILACIGPAIGPEKFEVGADVALQIQSTVQESIIHGSSHGSQAKQTVDLWSAVRSQLFCAGVINTETAGICTASNTHEWFSHRAERGRTGRFGVSIAIRSSSK